MKKQLLYFNFEDRIFEYHLPALNNRRYSFDLSSYTNYPCEISLEVWDGVWYVKQNEEVDVYVDGHKSNMLRLDTDMLFHIFHRKNSESFSVIVLEETSEVTEFKKYSLCEKDEYVIGAEENSDIIISEDFVSRKHALITKKSDGYYVKDTSKNGTFLNGQRLLGTMKLNCFDEIYILGVKLVFLGKILAINHADTVRTNMPEALCQCINTQEEQSEEMAEDTFFSRSPRNMEPLEETVVEIEAPPSSSKQKQQPLLFVLGPSVTMPLPIMMSILFNYFYNSKGMGIMMYVGTLISVLSSGAVGVMWALAHRNYNKKQEKEAETLRVNGYKKYIEQNKELLEAKHKYNKQILAKQFLSARELLQLPEVSKQSLWNRNVNHKDFMTVRLGKGKIDFQGKIVIPKERFSLVQDELSQLPYEVYEEYKQVEDAVFTTDLRNKKLVGVVGTSDKVMEIAKNLAIQIAALHCYTDVKLAFLYSGRNKESLEWAKWLPHVFTSDKKVRLMADDNYSYQNVLYELTGELRNREENLKNQNKGTQQLPHYVVFCTEKDLMEKEAIYSYMTSVHNYGFTFVLLYDEIDRLPNECTEIIRWDNEYSGVFALDKSKNAASVISFDTVHTWEAEKFAKELSGIYVNESSGGEIPTFIDFMEMLKIGKTEHWDLIKHYKENRAYESIKALIGHTYGNRPMYLDIHEKKYGPHGLVAGTTGSGKSETIMTFILSLAMNYHPDEVAFVLIDYKGGGMAKPFIDMPHTAGTITNIGNNDETESIDENQTRRALVSIKSEIHRRQKLFNDYNVNHIDAYMRLYRDNQTEEPLPHLIIISDEFAELKKEQPEFIKELVSAARVGRSLGIHLILATQKPAGVVDDEIWSNSRFKVCLRVQDKQDSMGMLKRPEAASLTGTGRAYLQIGNDEIFEQFQSAYAGAGYEPKDEIQLSQHNEASMIGLDGRKLVTHRKKQNTNNISQLKACIDYIKKVSEENNIKPVRALWLPQLPQMLYLEDIFKKYPIEENGLKAVFGLVDQPKLQKQYPAIVDLLKTTNLLITGNIGMGKTTLLQTILYSLVTRYGTDAVNFYCMDFSSRTFKIFKEVPHCGGVVLSEEEEAVGRMHFLISKVMEERKHLFEEQGVGSFQEYLSIKRIPMILLCIDNYSLYKELYQGYEEQLAVLLREGSKYGVQIIMTANSVSDLSYRTRQYFSNVIPLFLGEKSKYIDVFGVSPDLLPENCKGRGLLVADGIVEFQTALSVKAENEFERNQLIRNALKEVSKNIQNSDGAASVKILPRDEIYEVFANKFGRKNEIPLGYNVDTLDMEGISLIDTYCYYISAIEKKSITAIFENIEMYCKWKNVECKYVDSSSYDSLKEWALEVKNEFALRSRLIKEKEVEAATEEAIDVVTAEYGKKVYIIEDFSEFIKKVYATYADEEAVYPLVELFFRKGKGLGLYFFAGESISRGNDATSRSAYSAFMQYHTGIHFGGKLEQQKMFEFKMAYSKLTEALDFNVGCYMDKKKYKQVFMPTKEGVKE